MNVFKQRMIIMVLLSIILMGCQDNADNEDSKRELLEVESKYDHSANEIIEQDTNVGVYIIEKSYSLPIAKLKVLLENKGKTAIEYDNSIYLDTFQDGGWVQIPYNDELDFSMEAFELKPGETFEQAIVIENLNYGLTEGEYRIRKSIQVGTENITIADKFEIEN